MGRAAAIKGIIALRCSAIGPNALAPGGAKAATSSSISIMTRRAPRPPMPSNCASCWLERIQVFSALNLSRARCVSIKQARHRLFRSGAADGLRDQGCDRQRADVGGLADRFGPQDRGGGYKL